jgi:hypothetical protein
MTLKEKDREFLRYVQEYISENPKVASYVTEFIYEGIKDAFAKVQERAGDMETSLAIALWGVDEHKSTIKSNIKKWEGKNSLRWDWFLNEGEKK